MTTVAVAGASGFVGSQLLPQLASEFAVVGLARRTQSNAGNIEWRACDLFSAGSTYEALRGIDVAIYLVHSMMPSSHLFQGNFHDTDLLLADNFAQACMKQGVKQIIYLGGLVPNTGFVSQHLESRQEVEGVLQASGIPVTCLRAGIRAGLTTDRQPAMRPAAGSSHINHRAFDPLHHLRRHVARNSATFCSEFAGTSRYRATIENLLSFWRLEAYDDTRRLSP